MKMKTFIKYPVKTMRITFLTVLCSMLLTSCSGSFGQGDALTRMDSAFAEMSGWRSCAVNMQTYIIMTPIESDDGSDKVWFKYAVEGVVFTNPAKMHAKYTALMETISENDIRIEQYAAETDEGILVYQSSDEGWLKYWADDDDLIYSNADYPMKDVAEMRNYLIDAKYLQEELIMGQNALKYEATFSYEIYKSIIDSAAMSLNTQGDETVVYNVWIGKESGDILRYEASLEGLSDSDNTFDVTLTVEADFVAHDDAVKDFEIPEEVIATAKEVEGP